MKKSAYQKLKEENLKLKRELIELSINPDSLDSTLIKSKWIINYGAEKQLWFGDSNLQQKYTGILQQLIA